jgi:hypothetical protein
VGRTKVEAFWRSEGACWQAASPTSSAQARQENIREGSRQKNIREGSRQKNIREGARQKNIQEPNIEIVRHTRSSRKVFREDLHRDKIFKEALQRSSSLREKGSENKEGLQERVFIAVYGSAIEGGCCDSNATVHARG